MNNEENNSTFYSSKTNHVDRSFLGSMTSKVIVNKDLKESEALLKQIQPEINRLTEAFAKLAAETNKATDIKRWNDLQKLTARMESFLKEGNKNLEDTGDILTKAYDAAVKYNNELLVYDVQSGKTTQKQIKQKQDYISLLETERDISREITDEIEKHNKNAEEAMNNLKDSLGRLSTHLGQLATVTGINELKEGFLGKENSWLSLRNSYGATLGLNNNGSFDRFKNRLLDQVSVMNSQINQVKYSSDDVKTYVSNLSTLGIYDTKLAEEQLKAAIEGNKIANLSVETQANILKNGIRNNNRDALNSFNNTVATLLNSQIGLSKDLLSEMSNNSGSLATTLSFLGNTKANEQLLKGQAFVESKYGQGAGGSALNILNDLAANGVDSQYFASLGGNDILQLAKTDAGAALALIAENVNKSNMVNTATSGFYQKNAVSRYGLDDNVMSLYGTAQNGQTYEEFLSDTAANTATLADIAKNETMTLQEQMSNFFKNIFNHLPTETLLGVADAFYVASIAWLGISLVNDVTKIALLGSMAKEFGLMPTFLTKLIGVTPGSSLASSLLSISGGILGAIMAFKDGFDGYTKYASGEWKNAGPVSSAIGGALGGTSDNVFQRVITNLIKGAAIGTAINPGLGTLIGGGIGLILGLIGGENIANGLTSIWKFITGDTSSAKGGPIGGNIGGIGAASDNSGNWPWYVTSPFGAVRSYTNTQGKLINDVHNGIDLSKANASGTPIGANVAGTVVSKGVDGYGANYVVIGDKNGYKHQYWHLQSPSPLQVGQTVNAGQLIGLMGATGNVTGPHLHYGVKKPDGVNINPAPFITGNLFNATESGKVESSKSVSKINQPIDISTKLISSNTLQSDAVMARYANAVGGPSGSPDVVASVNSGFGALIDKLDELSARQDNTERMLQAITIPSGNSVYKY